MKGESNFFIDMKITGDNKHFRIPGNFAKKNLLYVQDAGVLQSRQPIRCAGEKQDSFLLLFLIEGSGRVEFAGKNTEVKTGDGVWINCMEHYEYTDDKDGQSEIAWVYFNGHNVRSFYELFLEHNRNEIVFCPVDVNSFADVLTKLCRNKPEKNLLSEMEINELLVHLLYMTLEAVIKNAVLDGEAEKRIAGEIREVINERYVEESIVALLESTFSKSIEELHAIFIKTYNISLKEYINNRRYNAAKELLRFSVNPMEMVANESGIRDIAVMQQMFHDKEGMSAEEYRKKWAGWVRN